ncbi:MAG: TolC family protein [Burkholderiales bacterium]|nr:TolC family protein [Burkholderiales bacterium]
MYFSTRSRLFRLSVLAFALATLVRPAAAALSLVEAQRIASGDAPQIDAQAATLRAAQQASVGAGELADPKLILGIDNIPTDGADKYNLTRDFMTMRKIGLMQEFMRDEKRKLRSDRAGAEVQKETAILALNKLNLRRDVALAWIERYFAERQLDLVKELAREGELQVTASHATFAGGKGQATDPFAARLAVAQLADRTTEAERNIARANANLARWIGQAARQPLKSPPAFDELSHSHRDLTSNLEAHPHLAMFAPLQAMASSEMALADAAKRPDWSLEVAFAQRGPSYSNMLSIGVRIDLPIFQSRRQDPAIASKLALVEQVRAQAEDARRIHAAEIETMFADWDAAKARLQRYRAELLPLAQERTAVALASYRGGKGDLAPVLEARKGEIETRMNHLTAQADLARAWAQLNFLLSDAKD